LSLWRKAAAVTGAVLAGAGLLWLKATLSFAEMGVAVVAFFLGLLLVGLAYAGSAEATGSEQRGG
jgi:hypothetical protein